MFLLLLAGLSGAGKSVALGALEDSGFYAVNHLAAPLLPDLIQFLEAAGTRRVAVALDLTSEPSARALPGEIKRLREAGHEVVVVFLDAKTETLIKRYSETRRRHPWSDGQRTLRESIVAEKDRLADLAALGVRLDTSDLKANALRSWIKDFVQVDTRRLTLVFQSFGFKHGIPLDADLVFDVRCLPNPYYEPELAPLTGRDAPVIAFLERDPAVETMFTDIQRFIANWLPFYVRDNRTYLTVAVGCTGGQHRSVYLVERLRGAFCATEQAIVRHREL